MSRVVFGFAGLMGCGKSTAAAHLVTAHGFHRVRFAGPLKAMMAALGLSEREIEGDLKEQPCALLGGKTPRWGMQSLGTEWGRNLIAPDLWIRAWLAACDKVPAGCGIVADDVRFSNEAAAIAAQGGRVIRIERDLRLVTKAHASEEQAFGVDQRLANNGSVDDLRLAIDAMLDAELRRRKEQERINQSWADAANKP